MGLRYVNSLIPSVPEAKTSDCFLVMLAYLMILVATSHMRLFKYKLMKFSKVKNLVLSHTSYISNTQLPWIVNDYHTGLFRCRTLPPSQNVFMGTFMCRYVAVNNTGRYLVINMGI